MGTPKSPSRMFNGLEENLYNDVKYTNEINDKMRVPKRIKATGEFSDDDLLLPNQNGIINSWNYRDKVDMMNVPDRIVVLGHNQHLETRSAPREIQLENSILMKDNVNVIRVQTPPHTITLSDHHFPSASEESSPSQMHFDGGDNFSDEALEQPSSYIRFAKTNGFDNKHAMNGEIVDANSAESYSQVTTEGGQKLSQSLVYNPNDTSNISFREGTPIVELTPSEEILYLRRQMAKLNRRILHIEISNEQRKQREKILYCLGLAYFVLKTFIWLNKN